MKKNIVFWGLFLFGLQLFAQSSITIFHADGKRQCISIDGAKFIFVPNNKIEIYERNNLFSEIVTYDEVKKITFNDCANDSSPIKRNPSPGVYITNDQLHILSPENTSTDIYILNMAGVQIKKLFQSPDLPIYVGDLKQGAYFIRFNESVMRFIK